LRLPYLILIVCLFLAAAPAGAGAIPVAAPPPPEQGLNPSLWPGQTLQFEHITLEDGLSQSSVLSILQDHHGFMWFGTEDGLNRYDGYAFKIFKPNPEDPFGINDRWINTLYEDRSGYLWIGTRLGGLNRYDPQTGRFIHYLHDPADPNSLVSNNIRAIYQDALGILWVGTESGLDWLDPATGEITHIRSVLDDETTIGSNRINVIFGSSSGYIFVGTADNGISRYLPRKQSFRRFTYNERRTEQLCSSSIEGITESFDGNLWLATPNGLTRLNPYSGVGFCFQNDPAQPDSLGDNSVNAVFVDRLDRLWVGTASGLDYFRSDTNTFGHLERNPMAPDSLSAETIYSIYEDRGEVLWVGTYGGGLNKHDQTQQRFAHFRHDPNNPSSLSDNIVFPIRVDSEGRVWVGTSGGGLNLFDPATGLFTRYVNDPLNPASLPNNRIWSIYNDSQENLWIGAGDGLSRLDPQTGQFTNYDRDPADPEDMGPETVYAMTEDGAGSLWLGTRSGIGRFNRELGIFLPEEFDASVVPGSSDRITSLWYDGAGNLWFGTLESGLYRYNLTHHELKNFSTASAPPNGLGYNTVLAITQDATGMLWIATGGGGLARYNSTTETFKVYTEKDGLPNNVIYGILEDDLGRLWMSTNYGLARFDPRTETFRNYTTNDGLGNMEFNMDAFARAPDGAMYFGSINGLNAFYPDHIIDNDYAPPIIITSLTYEGKSVSSESTPETVREIVLNPPQNSFEFEFVGLSFTATRRNRYAYMLEGFDKDWYNLGNKRTGRYTNLPSGKYTLLLKASNSDGVWSKTPLEIPVTVIPPVWEAAWFRLMLGMGAVLLIILSYRLRMRQVEGRNRDLEALVRARTAEIEKLFEKTKELAVIEERNRLARDLHDSAKQKAFAALAQLGTVQEIGMDASTARRHLVEAENLVAEVIQELTFLIQEIYPIALKEYGLPATVREYIYEWENRNGIPADVEILSPRTLELKREQAIYRIIQEALANVARHSKATHVAVNLNYTDNRVIIEITDNGRGFDIKSKLTGLGLRSIRERAQSVGGKARIESEPGQGTRVRVEVPFDAQTKLEKEPYNEEIHLHPDRG
jgi:ligand-binding sensor domain-containing protein/signal transduction histidine kinase